MTSNNSRLLIKIIFLFALIVAGTCAVVHYDLYMPFTNKQRLIAFIKSFHPYDALVFISLQILQVIAAPIPGEVTGIIGGYLYGSFLGTIYSTIGLTVGSWLAFSLSRTFGLALVEKTVKPAILQKYDYIMEHQGVLVSFFLFLIPGFPKDYLCYIMGLSHMRTVTFLVISTIGRLWGTVLLSVCGGYARNDQYGALAVAIGCSAVFLFISYLYRKKIYELLKKTKVKKVG